MYVQLNWSFLGKDTYYDHGWLYLKLLVRILFLKISRGDNFALKNKIFQKTQLRFTNLIFKADEKRRGFRYRRVIWPYAASFN